MKFFHLGVNKKQEDEESEIIDSLDIAITQLSDVISKLRVVQARAELLQKHVQADHVRLNEEQEDP